MNPFTVNNNEITPDSFIGRKPLINTAFNQIKTRSSLAIWGGTGMGKSSFLELLKCPAIWQQYGLDITEKVIVLFDCQTIEPFKASEFWRNILRGINHNYPALTTDITPLLEKEKPTHDDLINILGKLGQQNKTLLLLIDNYDIGLRINYQHTEADIQTLVSGVRTIDNAETVRQYISMVVTSSRRLSDIGPPITPDSSPWFNQFMFRHLRPFTDEEVALLLSKNKNLLDYQENIRKIADGNPALLQNACYLLSEELEGGKTLNPSDFITNFQSETLHLFQTMWGLSNEIEQLLLMLLALLNLEGKLRRNRYSLEGIEGILSQKEIDLNNLVERGILKQVEGEKVNYAFCSSIMEWWVIKQIENSNIEELNKRQRTFLNLMSRRQTEKVKTAISWMWQNKDKIVPIIDQLRKFL